MQKAFINKIYELAENDKDIVLLTADNGTDFDILFSRELPEQYFNVGIAEQNMIAMAAGMAMCGKKPYVCSSGAFLAYRGYEFIRNDVCLQNQNVKIVALGSGMSISALGPTHHTTEDMAALMAIPNLKIISVATPIEMEEALIYANEHEGPVYLRVGMNASVEFYESTAPQIEKVNVLREGVDVAVFATGGEVKNAITVAENLKEHISICVAEIISIKPIDEEGIVEIARNKKCIYTIEEHNVIGGLGARISDILMNNGIFCKVKKIGLQDCFAVGFAQQDMLQEYNCIGAVSLEKAIKEDMDE